MSKYGHSKGWNSLQLNTANGFHVRALGLDVAARGLKKDHYRPDLILFDDIDDSEDSPKTVEKKERSIRAKIMGAGSDDVAFLFLQNLIHDNSVICRLLDGVTEWLLDREVAPIEPAVTGLKVEKYEIDDGSRRWRIIEGVPTWEGQGLDVCERQINSLGIDVFRREMQHEVRGALGYFFDENGFEECEASKVPPLKRIVLAFDRAATEGGGDWTVGVLAGLAANGRIYILHVVRKQYGTDKVRKLIKAFAVAARKKYGPLKVLLAQDPGSSGVSDAEQLKAMLTRRDRNEPNEDRDFEPFALEQVLVQPVTGSKATRAHEWQLKVNSGNASLVIPTEQDKEWLPLLALDDGLVAQWHRAYRREHQLFREDEEHDFDDQVDPSADIANEFGAVFESWAQNLDALEALKNKQ